MNELFAGLRFVPNMKFTLGQSDGDAFAAVVQHEECDDVLSDPVFGLAGDGGFFRAENPAAVDNGELMGRQ